MVKRILCFFISIVILLSVPKFCFSQNPAVIEKIDTLITEKKFDEAIKVSLDYLALKPSDTDIRIRLGKLYAWTGKYPEAISIYDSLLTENPENYDIKLLKAQVLSWAGDYKNAESFYNDVIKNVPNYFDAYWGLINNYSFQKDYKNALKICGKLEILTPSDEKLLAKMMELYYLTGNYIKAGNYNKETTTLNPSFKTPEDIKTALKITTLTAGYDYESLTKNYDPWKSGGLGINFKPMSKYSFSLNYGIYNRFKKYDRTISAGTSFSPVSALDFTVIYQKCPNAKILPKDRLDFDCAVRIVKGSSLLCGYKYFDFSTENVNNVSVGIEQFLTKNFIFAYQYFNTHALKVNSPNQVFKLTISDENKFSVAFGYTNGKEVYRVAASENPGIIKGTSVFTIIRYYFNDSYGVSLNSSYFKRKGYFDSRDLGGGIIYKF
jgi:YaiO family outer membrane protein